MEMVKALSDFPPQRGREATGHYVTEIAEKKLIYALFVTPNSSFPALEICVLFFLPGQLF